MKVVPICLPRPIIKPFDPNNFLLTMIHYNIEKMGKLPRVHCPDQFFIESQLRVKYDQTIYM